MSSIFIIIIAITLYAVAIGAIWNGLGELDKTKKVILIIAQILLVYIITLIIFLIGKGNINYPNEILATVTRRTLVIIFAGVNSIGILPFISKNICKLHAGDMGKEEFMTRTAIILVIFVIFLVLECSYMRNTQQGIINIYNNKS